MRGVGTGWAVLEEVFEDFCLEPLLLAENYQLDLVHMFLSAEELRQVVFHVRVDLFEDFVRDLLVILLLFLDIQPESSFLVEGGKYKSW